MYDNSPDTNNEDGEIKFFFWLLRTSWRFFRAVIALFVFLIVLMIVIVIAKQFLFPFLKFLFALMSDFGGEEKVVEAIFR